MEKSVIIVKSSSSKKQLKRFLNNIKNKKRFDAKKYSGCLKGVFGDALEYQKKMRDEWA